MAYKQPCPHCGAILTLNDSQSGRAVRCDHCQVTFLAHDFAPIAPPVSVPAPTPTPAENWPNYRPPREPRFALSENARKNLIWVGIALGVIVVLTASIYGVLMLSMGTVDRHSGSIVASPPPAPPPIGGPIMQPMNLPTTPAPIAPAPAPAPIAPALPPPPGPTTTEVFNSLSDARVGAALRGGAQFLIDQCTPNGVAPTFPQRTQFGPGVDGLCVYALLQANVSLHDPRLAPSAALMGSLLDQLRDEKIDPKETMYCTYAHSVRLMALVLAGRAEDRAAILDDLQWLMTANTQGGYSYNTGGNPDNSNSQYGLLGVWAAADDGYNVPASFWEQVQNYWNSSQNDGGWGYPGKGSGPKLSMTCAGIVSLFVTHDYLDPAKFRAQVGRAAFSDELKRGLDRLAAYEGELLQLNGPADGYTDGYTAYGIERVGLASGFKYIGKTDWYRALAAEIIVNRLPAAIAGKNIIDSSFYMLFLARGRHGLIMNKLLYDGDWANRPRDIANLAHFASHDLERQLNWHVVPATLPWTEWFDAPILELSSADRPKLSDEQIANLRLFILNGGLLFTNADGGSKSFDAYVHELAAQLFPQYPMTDVPDNHFLLNIEYTLDKPPKLQYVTNGVRPLIVHSPSDLTQYWQVRTDKQSESAFQAGVNLFVAVAGKSDYRMTLDRLYIPPPEHPSKERMMLTQLKYAGNWDPEPAALTRFDRMMERDENIGVDVSATATPQLKPGDAPLALLTGTDAVDFNLESATAIRNYVERGGVLLVEPAGGSRAFYDHFLDPSRALLFPGSRFEAIPAGHPLLNGKILGSHALPTPAVRSFAADQPNPINPRLQYIRYGKGVVILSPLDLQSGLLGTNTWGIAGYTPEYSQDFMKNLVLWVQAGAPEPDARY